MQKRIGTKIIAFLLAMLLLIQDCGFVYAAEVSNTISVTKEASAESSNTEEAEHSLLSHEEEAKRVEEQTLDTENNDLVKSEISDKEVEELTAIAGNTEAITEEIQTMETVSENSGEENGNGTEVSPEDIFIFDGNRVTGLKEGVTVTELVIPEGVTEIASGALQNKGITKVTLPESLEVIRGSALARNALTEITLPTNVTTIENYAFDGNVSLAEVKLESSKLSSCGTFIFRGCNINSIGLPEEMLIVPQLFNSAGLQIGTSVTIPAGVKVIGANAFRGTNLKEVIFVGNGVTEIQSGAFDGCKLEKITLPESLEVIRGSALARNALTEIIIPSNVTTIGAYAFDGNGLLSKVVFPAGITDIHGLAFRVCDFMKAYVVRDSYAHKWAEEKNIECVLVNAIHYNLNGGTNHQGNKAVFETRENFVFQAPTKNGYTFDGWYRDKKFKKKIVSTENENDNLELYAKWKLATYNITYDLDGGTVTGNPSQYNISKNVKLKNPKKAGYVFDGWYLQKGETEEKVAYIAKGTYGNLLLVANWKENQYTIKFMGNGGVTQNGENFVTENHLYSVSGNLINNVFVKKGYEFTGWNTKSNGKGTTYNDGETVSRLSAKNNAVVILYAMWEPDNFWITYELNRTVSENNPNPEYYDIAKGLTLKKPVRTGYTFDGWYLDEGYNSKVTKLGANIAANVTLYAKWIENTYNVTFNTNGGKAKQGIVTKLKGISYTGVIDFPQKDKITRDGYVLKEWNTKKDGTGSSYGLEDSFFKIENVPAKNKATLTLYAVWEPIPYSITYELNGTVSENNPNPNYYTAAKDVKLLAPVKPGYTFLGWYTDAEYKTKVTSIKKNTKQPLHLYAKWSDEVNVFHVNFNLNGGKGTVAKLKDVKFTDEVKLPTAITREGYVFAGWNTAKKGTGVTYIGESVTGLDTKNKGTITLFAMWTAIEHKITYQNVEGVTANPNPEIYTIAKDVSLKKPVKPGYTFKGWYADKQFVTKFTKISKKLNKDVTLYAKWEENTYSVKFHANGGEGSAEMQKNLKYSAGITLPGAESFNREGYELVGWNTKKKANGVSYLLNDPLLKTQGIDTKNKATITLYAVWQPIEHSITYLHKDMQGNLFNAESIANDNPAVYTVEKDVWLKAPKKAGYKFRGWYNAEGKRVILVKKTWTEDITLYGKWEARE